MRTRLFPILAFVLILAGGPAGAQTLPHRTYEYGSLFFLPGDSILISADGGDERRVKWWDTATGRLLASQAMGPRVYTVDLSEDGTLLAEGNYPERVRVYDARQGTLLWDRQSMRKPKPEQMGAWGAAFSPGNRYLVTWGGSHGRAPEDPYVRVWEARTGRPVAKFQKEGHGFVTPLFTRDGEFLAYPDGGAARIVSLATGKPVGSYAPSEEIASMVAVGPGSRLLFRLSGPEEASDRLVLLDAADAKVLKQRAIPQGNVHLQVSPDGRRVLCRDGLVVSAETLDTVAQVTPVQLFLGDGRAVGINWDDRTVKVWDLASGSPVSTMKDVLTSVLQCSPSGLDVVGLSPMQGQGAWWDADSGRDLVRRPFPGTAAAFSSDGRILAAWGEDGIHLYDVQATRSQAARQGGPVAPVPWKP